MRVMRRAAVAAAVALALAAAGCTPGTATAPAAAHQTTLTTGSGSASALTVAPVTPGQPTAATGAPTTTTTTAPPTLSGQLDAALGNTNSCLLVTDGTAAATSVLYNHAADTALTPASSQKLFVALAALDRLGPDYRFTTTVVAARPPVAGVVDALWMVGGGDPLLATAPYIAALHASRVTSGYQPTPVASLADQLAAKGVKAVSNGIHGDDSRYERLRYLPTWSPAINHGEFDVGPLGALEVDQGLESWTPAVVTPDPAAHGAAVLAQLLTARHVTGTPGVDQTAPAGAAVLASVTSAPMSQIILAMLQASDNQIAELLVRELDRRAGGAGTMAGGVREVMADMGRLGLPVQGLSLVDGSGLSHANQVTCRTLLAALDQGDQPRFGALTAGLPVAGVSGGMSFLFTGTPLAGRLAAKGGYISGVTAMVGRLSGPRPRHFALVANGSFSFGDGLGLSERVAKIVAAYAG
ncbi:MAG: D-alanyl-D-alanine carboxypeptidase/D-alanyl-D-alanine-endopeptidase [Actinomycetota bacterium]|nr:D-alanyl-D-alanine carboxypeptidase/D-alanyl-D-alanine-endopeptidase [Actinomycetota bacterium]